MGDLISVVQGTDADETIAAMRAYYDEKFALGLTL